MQTHAYKSTICIHVKIGQNEIEKKSDQAFNDVANHGIYLTYYKITKEKIWIKV